MLKLWSFSTVRYYLLVIATAVALLWPAFINGGPFWFPDTSTYIRSADAASLVATGAPSEWSDRLTLGKSGPLAIHSTTQDLIRDREQLQPTRQIFQGRSIYYGFLIYLPMRLFGPWGAIVLQALLTAAIILSCGSTVLGEVAGRRRYWALAALAGLVLFTPLPFYVSMLMPDIYSGLMVLALATILLFWRRLSRYKRATLIIACAAMASFHTTHLLLALIMAVLGTMLWLMGRIDWRAVLALGPVVVLAILGNVLFSAAVQHSLHRSPISPPFLSARLTAEGPGTDYLKQACAQHPDHWALCPYVAKLPLDSDSFLWSENPKTGVFQLANDRQQRRMAHEDKRFALAVLGYDPGTTIEVSLRAAVIQLVSFDLLNFNYPKERITELETKYPPAIAQAIARTRAARNSMPTGFTVAATIGSTIIALLGLIALLWPTKRQGLAKGDPHAFYALLIVVLVVANAAICGGLSGPHARYQMRLIWLLPYAAAVLAAVQWTRSRRQDSTRGAYEANYPDTVL